VELIDSIVHDGNKKLLKNLARTISAENAYKKNSKKVIIEEVNSEEDDDEERGDTKAQTKAEIKRESFQNSATNQKVLEVEVKHYESTSNNTSDITNDVGECGGDNNIMSFTSSPNDSQSVVEVASKLVNSNSPLITHRANSLPISLLHVASRGNDMSMEDVEVV
jgi:hypothetical protein